MNPFENLPPQSGEELARQKKVLDYLDKLGIQYDYYRHPPAQSMEDCAAFDRALSISGTHCKNLFCATGKRRCSICWLWRGINPSVRRRCPASWASPA